ncbi:MAG: flavoprotein [Bacillota bacterium]|nr:flavoprotein [Bacillota bacterium]
MKENSSVYYDVIIIGGGPAGLFSALSIKNKDVLLIEKNKSLGIKLLITGLGQCNYTNFCSNDQFLTHYGQKGRFLKPALYKFTNKDSMNFFDKVGVKSIVREDNKVFPSSFKAGDILNALIEKCKENHVKIMCNTKADYVKYNEDSGCFSIKANVNIYECKYLILSTGGKSYEHTGSTGDGYKFAKILGHSIEETHPSLTPVFIENYDFHDLSGISFENIKITSWRNNKKINEFTGDMLFTHKNISGPVIINNSRYIEVGDILKFNFTQFKNSEEFKKYFEEKLSLSGKLNVKTLVKELNLPKRFVDKIMNLANISDDLICSQLSKTSRKALIDLLSNHEMKVEKLGNYNVAMATRGGVSTNEINAKTMESKIINNLYFAGEVMDVDGDTGGYNIQAAFSTGKLAADSINLK